MILPSLILLLASGISFAEVVTLRKDKSITCVLTEDFQSGIHLTPNSTKKLFSQNSTNNISWDHNGWMLGDSEYHLFKPITDTRWNELPDFHILNYYKPKKIVNLSLSVCSPPTHKYLSFKVKLLRTTYWIYPPTIFVSVTSKSFEYCSWVHFTIWAKNNKLLLTTDNDTRTVFTTDSPIEYSWLRFEKDLFYSIKSHSYSFFWSNTSSSSIEAGSFAVQSSESRKICFNFFVSIDKGCKLDIILVTDGAKTNLTETIEGFNNPTGLKIWQHHKITYHFSGKGRVYFIRKKKWGSIGFWAIDRIRYCNHNSAVSFTTTLDSNEETAACQQIKNNDNESLWIKKNLKAGCLGNKCVVTCEGILGASYKYCQEHTICVNNGQNCFCAWGFKGVSHCKEGCGNGSWGIDCVNKCGRKCLQCNPQNGTCEIDESKPLLFPKSSTTENAVRHLEKTTQSTSISSTPPARTSLLEVLTTNHFTTPNLRTSTISTTKLPRSKSNTKKSSNLGESSNKDLPMSSQSPSPSKSGYSSKSSLPYILTIFCVILTTITVCGTCVYFLHEKFTNGQSMRVPDLGPSNFSVIDFDNSIKKALTEDTFVHQFNALTNDSAQESMIALSPRNKRKNYDNINIPYDQSRVVLKPMRDVGTDSYINASYIDGWGRSRAYIVTQGPKSSTMADFWRMIWQHDVKIIVMATQFRENMQRKSFEYFPTYLKAVLPAEDFNIKLVKHDIYEFYTKRILEIYYRSYHKIVTHYQLKWSPDSGKPLYPNNLVPLVKIMNENYAKNEWSQIVVHCSLGVQRSAILILSNLAVEMARKEGYVDVYLLAKMLREQRPNMITSAQDYILAHMVISECLMAQDARPHTLRYYPDVLGLQTQLEYLRTCKWHDTIVCARPFAAVQSNGTSTAYIPLKQPQTPQSINSFWLTVLQKKIKTIIFLNNCHLRLWPSEIRISQRRICTINSSNSKNSIQHPYYEKHHFIMKERDIRTTTLYEEEIDFYQMLNWNFHDQTESSIETFIQFVEDCRNLNPIPDKILICCSNGFTGCGLFLATTFIIEKHIKEIEYDVFNPIRNIRRTDSRFISDADDLGFLYKVISVYSQKFDPYKNIDNDFVQ